MKHAFLGIGIGCIVLGLVLLTIFRQPPTFSVLPSPEQNIVTTPPPPFIPPPVTMANLLDNQVMLPADRSKLTIMLVTGDVLTARTVNRITTDKNDFTWAWQKTADVLSAADITYINLETPLVSNCPIKEGGFVFCGDPRHVTGLRFGGVDVINLANNHMGNYGLNGVEETVRTLQTSGFTVSGVTNTEMLTHHGKRYAFLGYNEVDQQVGIALAEDQKIRQEIAAARQNADVVVVQFHWGAEYQYQPTTNQKRLAHLAIDSGADVVVGNHPHWWQPPEIYQDKVIMYSHGNFIFDQMWSAETREGIVAKYYFYHGQFYDMEFLPIRIEDYGQPRWLVGAEKEAVLTSLRREAAKLNQ